MKWQKGYQSRDVIDQRGGGRGFRVPGGAKGGVGGIVIVLLAAFFGRDFIDDPSQRAPLQTTQEEEELKSFISFVLDDVQNTFEQEFKKQGKTYQRAKLVMFRGEVNSRCGIAGSDVGPFYCPADQFAYIDLGFYQDLQTKFNAHGDFAQAYVIAHEIGHHLQRILGTNQEVHLLSQQNPDKKNELSIRQELQADCYAGVWAHFTKRRDILEKGDIKEGLDAAAAVGDDRLQKMSSGRVTPETWTHGSSAQRVKWFTVGFEQGSLDSCNTFAVLPSQL